MLQALCSGHGMETPGELNLEPPHRGQKVLSWVPRASQHAAVPQIQLPPKPPWHLSMDLVDRGAEVGNGQEVKAWKLRRLL